MRVIRECRHCGKGKLYPKSEPLSARYNMIHTKYWEECDYCGHTSNEHTTKQTTTN